MLSVCLSTQLQREIEEQQGKKGKKEKRAMWVILVYLENL